eukprot:4562892-Prymnesium_polylepis.1
MGWWVGSRVGGGRRWVNGGFSSCAVGWLVRRRKACAPSRIEYTQRMHGAYRTGCLALSGSRASPSHIVGWVDHTGV